MTTEPQADIVERARWHASHTVADVRQGHAIMRGEWDGSALVTEFVCALTKARLQGRSEGLEAWNRWYDAATTDDDCEYLNGEGWNYAAKLRAIDPATLLKDADHGRA